MTAAIARAVMRVTAACLGESRREWAAAMHGEFASAIEDERPLSFAMGCLVAAWREMPSHGQGRFTLANHALALGVLIPMAVVQFQCVLRVPYALLTPGNQSGLYLAETYRSAVGPLVALWILLGLGHLRLAWALLDRDWPRVVSIAALTVAACTTLLVFTVVLFLDDPGATAQALLLIVELSSIYALGRWHSRLFPSSAVKPTC
jgi:hypothetical protein